MNSEKGKNKITNTDILYFLTMIIIIVELLLIGYKIDVYIFIIAIIFQSLLLVSIIFNNSMLCCISHYAFYVILSLIIFCSKNKYSNCIVLFLLITTAFTRRVFKDCLFAEVDKNQINITTRNIDIFIYIFTLIILFKVMVILR